MRIPIQWCLPQFFAIALLLATSGKAIAQSAADQSFKNIPQQARDNAETKATTKTSNMTTSALNKADSLSGKALKGLTGIFKKKDHSKNKNQHADSTGTHTPDSTAVTPKSGAWLSSPFRRHPELSEPGILRQMLFARKDSNNLLII